jgi:hypothetical protein
MSNMDQHDDRAEQPSSQDEVTTTPAPHSTVSEQGTAPFNPPYPQISPYPPNTPYPQMSQNPPGAQYAQYPQLTYYPPMQPYPAPTKHKGKTRNVLLIVGFVLSAILIITGVLLAFINKASSTLSQVHLSTGSATGTPVSISAPTGQPIFTDNFTDNGNEWWTGQKSGYGAAITNNKLQLHEGNGKYLVEAIPGSINWSNYRMDMTYVLPRGSDHNNWVGIAFREQKATESGEGLWGYDLMIVNTGHYIMHKFTTPAAPSNGEHGSYETLGSGIMDTVPSQGTPVNITLFVKGNTMVVAINNHGVSSYTDTTNPFTTGYLALMVGNAKGSPAQQVAFTHVDVYPAPSQLPSLN